MQELALVGKGRVRDVLKDVCVIHHFLKRMHAQDTFNLVVEALIVDKVWIDDDLVHKTLHDLFVLLLVLVLILWVRSLRRWLDTSRARLAHDLL